MKRLVLVGGGHAHLEVLRELARRRASGADVVLISPSPLYYYSGMVPGYVQGTYADGALRIDLAALCRVAGATFREAAVEQLDGGGRWVDVGGERMPCDLVSLDVGSDARGLDGVPGARAHAATIRPMERAVVLRERLLEIARAGGGDVCVVGGGAAGVEIALASQRVVGATLPTCRVTIVDEHRAPLAALGTRAAARARAILEGSGVHLAMGHAVAAVTAAGVTLDSGVAIPAALTIWLTGAAPVECVRSAALPKDAGGFVLVDETLRSVGGGAVWGAGDCVSLRGAAGVVKAGVYAVREAPTLAQNLRAALNGGPARRYRPQRQALAILNTADGGALLCWSGIVAHGRWAMRLKDRIDRGFVRRYQAVYEERSVPRSGPTGVLHSAATRASSSDG